MTRNGFFRPEAIVADMATVLPTHKDGDTTSIISSSLDAIGLFVHACMRIAGFRLLGFSEDRDAKIESQLRESEPRLTPEWNNSINSHSFLYAHEQSSMQFLIRVDRMGSKVEIRGLAVGDERITRVEITARDYISSAALPVRATLAASTTTETTITPSNDLADLEQKLSRVFMSPERIEDLASLLKIKIIQRLLPEYTKEGWTEEEDPDDRAVRQDADAAGHSGTRHPPAHQPPSTMPEPARPTPYPLNDPLAAPPRRPIPPGDFPPPDFEDEYEINRPPHGPLGGGGVLSDYGRSDLYPQGLGPDDPIRGSLVPGRQGGGLPRPGGAGGMHPTFDDPLFLGPRGPGASGAGGDGFDPQAPPGARWDPVGPGGFPRFGGGRGGGAFGGGFGGGGFGGDII